MAEIHFHFERPGFSVPVYSFLVREDGSGIYTATYQADPSLKDSPATVVQSLPDQTETKPLSLSASTTAKLFAEVKNTQGFRGGCASKAKNIADTGTKMLSYKGGEGTTSCTYNYSENKPVVEMTTIFQAMAFTLDAARKLDRLRRFDRLGLDREMSVLADAAENGRAIEMANIASSLHSIIDDEQVLERVRMRATKLLEQGTTTH